MLSSQWLCQGIRHQLQIDADSNFISPTMLNLERMPQASPLTSAPARAKGTIFSLLGEWRTDCHYIGGRCIGGRCIGGRCIGGRCGGFVILFAGNNCPQSWNSINNGVMKARTVLARESRVFSPQFSKPFVSGFSDIGSAI